MKCVWPRPAEAGRFGETKAPGSHGDEARWGRIFCLIRLFRAMCMDRKPSCHGSARRETVIFRVLIATGKGQVMFRRHSICL